MRRQSTQGILLGLIISAVLLLTGCGLFGGSDEPGGSEVTTATEGAAESNESAETTGADASDDSANKEESTADESSDESSSTDISNDGDGSSIITDSGLEIITIEEGPGPQTQCG